MAEQVVFDEQHYYVECEGVRFGVKFEAVGRDEVLPARLELPCIRASCTVGSHVLLPVTGAEFEVLMADEGRLEKR